MKFGKSAWWLLCHLRDHLRAGQIYQTSERSIRSRRSIAACAMVQLGVFSEIERFQRAGQRRRDGTRRVVTVVRYRYTNRALVLEAIKNGSSR